MSLRFALNHMTTPQLSLADFFALARRLGMREVEIRNDLDGNAILDGTPAAAVKAAAAAAGVTIYTINAQQRFNDWGPVRAAEATALADYAQACGCRALVLVPVCDGTAADQDRLVEALAALKPILAARGLIGLVEPLGFEFCSLRNKSDAVAAIDAVEGRGVFKLVHDTFHHHLAGEAATFPELTGLVHISGVTDAAVTVPDMRDSHRVLVDASDRLDNLGQIKALLAAGYDGPCSFEPFASEVHALTDPEAALRASMDYIVSGV